MVRQYNRCGAKMDWETIGALAGAFSVGAILTGFVVHWIMARNRYAEADPNKTLAAPSQNELAWHLVHVRDDVGSLLGAVAITNGLLAAILYCLAT